MIGTENTETIAATPSDEPHPRRFQEALVRAQKLESVATLMGGLAHDFNNLLAVILSDTELALEELEPESSAANALREIAGAAHRAEGLARLMMTYAGRDRTHVERVSANAVVEESASLALASLGRGYQVWFDLAPGAPLVQVDSTQLSQVVMNLVMNAGDALTGVDEARIRVSTAVVGLSADEIASLRPRAELSPGVYCAILVVDNGCGMDQATLDRLFEPFFTTKPGGHGLGLASAHAIVRGRRGAIDVQSARGIGSAFRVLLPIAR